LESIIEAYTPDIPEAVVAVWAMYPDAAVHAPLLAVHPAGIALSSKFADSTSVVPVLL
jgi:hypothetical protein